MPNINCKLQKPFRESEVEHIDVSDEDQGFNLHHNSAEKSQPSNVSPLNSNSFTRSRLAALDAKYAHLNKPIEKINLNAVLASVSPYRCRLLKHQPMQAVKSQKAEIQSIMNRTMDTQTIERLAFDNQSVRNQSLKSRQVEIQPVRKLNTQAIRDRSVQNKTNGVSKQNNCYISADKSVLAFGFVDGDTTHELSVKITNDSDEPIWLQPFIVHSEKSQFDQRLLGFRLKNTNSFSLDPKASRLIDVEFTPKAIKTYNGQLRLRLMSKDEPEFVVQLFGYGARACLDVYTRNYTHNFQKITMCADEIGICDLDRSMKEVELILANSGKRDAFVYIKAVNSSDQSLSSEMITIVPDRVIVRKSTQEYAKIRVAFNHNTCPTKTPTRSSLARLQIVWGEERQRMRLKEYLKQNAKESNSKSVIQYVAKHFDGEHNSRNEKIIGNWDLSRFLGSVRLMTIQFVDTHAQPKVYVSNTLSRQISSVPSTISEGTVLLSGSKVKHRSA